MRVLYHLWLSPSTRKVRIVLREKNLVSPEERGLGKAAGISRAQPGRRYHVMIEPDGTVLADTAAIVEYLDEVYREDPIINPVDRAGKCGVLPPGSISDEPRSNRESAR
jgi:glutathione S-transferase